MSVTVELPGIYLDAIEEGTSTGLVLANTVPEGDSVDAPVDTNVAMEIHSTDTEAVDVADTQVYINSVLAFDGGTFQSGFDGPSSAYEYLSVVFLDAVTDGDMEDSGTTAWTANNYALLTKETADPADGTRNLKVDYGGMYGPYATQTCLQVGREYRVTGWARGDGSSYPLLDLGTTTVFTGTSSTSWQRIDVTGTPNAADLRLWSVGTSYCEFDGIHVYTTDTNILNDGDMEYTTIAAWTAGNSATLIKGTTTPYEGTRCLRVDYNATPDPYAYQSVTTVGELYRIVGWARSDGSGVPTVYDGTTLLWTGTTSTSWQQFDVTFVAANADPRFYCEISGAGYCEFDAVVLEQLHDLSIVIDPTTDFSSEEVVSVRVVSETIGDSYTLDETYTFTVEDTIKPTLVSAQATGPFIVRCTFSEDMLAVGATGTNDALNPDNYTFAYQAESDRIAGVAVYAESVTQISGTVFDVTVDMTPTFWKTYLITCGDIADDSSNQNIIEANYRTAEFTSWHPPYWPARRQFDLWSMFSDDDHEGDTVIGDIERMVSAYQDIADVLLWDIDAEQLYHDIDKAPEWAIDLMLLDLGNPFSLDLTLDKKRKLVNVLIDIYREKGTDEGIVDVARFFLGIEITSVTEINVDTWILGESELGVDTDLGPSGQAELYTFWLNVDEELSDEDRRLLEALVDYMKPAHTHYLIVEPTDPLYVDHVELGLSELGVSWDLH